MKTCQYCNEPADIRWVHFCDLHQALGAYFQYETDGCNSQLQSFEEAFERWLNGLSEEQKQQIYQGYWLGQLVNPR